MCLFQREDVCASGCSFGSLAAEIMKSDLDVHDEVAAGPERGGRHPAPTGLADNGL
jgi:hypothetical protein